MKKRSNISIRLLGFSFVLIIAAIICTKHAVPIYDGVGFPDEPYRYVNPPSNDLRTNTPPSSAVASATLTNGGSASEISSNSDEQGPQIVLYISPNSLTADPSVTSITITAKPVAVASKDGPTDGVIAGNDYIVSSDSPVTFHDTTNTSIIDLRLPQAYSKTTALTGFEFKASDSSTWKKVATLQVGGDIYQTPFTGFGEYAMVAFNSKTPAHLIPAPTDPYRPPLFYKTAAAIVVFILIAGSTIVGIRLDSRKKRQHNQSR